LRKKRPNVHCDVFLGHVAGRPVGPLATIGLICRILSRNFFGVATDVLLLVRSDHGSELSANRGNFTTGGVTWTGWIA
jgi:hypothetical protein